MQRLKFAALAVVLMLGAGLSFNAQAQRKGSVTRAVMPLPISGVLSGSYNSSVSATEIGAGEVNNVSNEMYGWTLQGVTNGDLSGFLFLSVNYTWPPFGFDPSVTPDSTPLVTNIICGGSWSKLIFVDGVYRGSVSGKITGGTITWDDQSQTSTMELTLTSDNATDDYVGSVGGGAFTGTLDRSGKFGATLVGKISLKY